jgi:hypothetical protein
MSNLLTNIVGAVDWWSRRRKQYVTIPEAFKEFGTATGRESLGLVSEWWTLAEEEYKSTLAISRELTIADDRAIALLMGTLVYSFYGEEPSGKSKGPYTKVDKEVDLSSKAS